MEKKEYKHVDREKMLLVLEQSKGKCAEVILRLAWNMGLSLAEIKDLTWPQVSFAESTISISGRCIPMDEGTQSCLQKWHDRFIKRNIEYVVISDLRHVHVTRVSMSRFANDAMKQGGLEDITLWDLRHDYVIRLLEQYDLPYVARVSGMNIRTLKQNYSQFVKTGSKVARNEPTPVNVDEERIRRLVKDEGAPLGVAIWLSWKLDMSLEEITGLAWQQIDLSSRILQSQKGYIFIDDTLAELLQQAQASRDPAGDPHVILTPKAKKPYDIQRLSVVMRDTLIRGGLENTQLRQLKQGKEKKGREDLLLEYIEKNKSMTMLEAMDVLQTTYAPAYRCMQRLKEQGKVLMIGSRYYLAGTVVPPEQQYEVVRTYLEKQGSSEIGEIAKLLNIESRRTAWILHKMIEEGKLQMKGKTYSLPGKEE